MRFKVGFSVLVIFVILVTLPAFAEEGMWQLDKFNDDLFKQMKNLGLELSQDEIYTSDGEGIASAIVNLGGGTGTFVSGKGLILTNHHVAFGALQRTSSTESNFIEEGFYADSYDKEINAPGYRASILISIEDVSGEILDAAKGLKGVERYEAIENKTKEIVKKAEDGKDVKCKVSSFYGGMQYKLFTSFTMKDVRIVYAPPKSIGNYGGDIDNWMWPRHTGDFSFFRAYVAPDGSSAEYAEENVPFEPDMHLAISTKGYEKDDYAMIIGIPGRTMRYRSSYSVEYNQNWSYPNSIKVFGEIIDLFKKAAEENPAVAIKVASFDQMLNNAMKNYEGMLEGFKKAGLLELKIKEEKEFTEWLGTKKEMKKKYGDVLSSIEALYKEQETYREKSFVMGFSSFGCQMLRAANTLVRWSEEKTKEDLDRDPGFMERDKPRLMMGLRTIQMSYDENVDKKALKYFLIKSQELPEEQRIEGFDNLLAAADGGDIESKIDNAIEKLYAATALGTVEERMRVFELSREEVLGSEDAFIQFALSLDPETRDIEKRGKEFAGEISAIRPKLIEAYRQWKGGAFYPDANSTIRLTFGTVKGYSPEKDIQYGYITSLGGVVAKHTGEAPFDCPEIFRDIKKTGDYGKYKDEALGDIPVNFLSTCDITGGNSGSPIMNGKGEVIGAAFDGNYESISADYLFDESLTRCISVDSRYILFVLDKYSGAENLLNELTIH